MLYSYKNREEEMQRAKKHEKMEKAKTNQKSKIPLCPISESEVAQSCPTVSNCMDCSLPGSSCTRDSPDRNTGVGCHALLHICLSLSRERDLF